jgi:DNA modification methylase
MAIEPNLLIASDALLLLEKMESESVDMIYLDPPWPTQEDPFDAKRRTYRTFIYKVLQQAYRVVKRTGNVFFYSRPDLNLDFGPLLKDVFGTQNFVAEFVIPLPTAFNAHPRHWTSHETILFYKRSDDHVQNMAYKLQDNEFAKYFQYHDKSGKYRLLSLFASNTMANLTFEWKKASPPKGQSWRFSREQLDRFWEDNLIYVDEKGRFHLKKYLDEKNLLIPVGTIWNDLSFVKDRPSFSTQQGIDLLERVIHIGSQEQQTVLDPFCGSGSSIIACLRLERKFIACDNNPEAIKICQERINKEGLVAFRLLTETDLNPLPTIWDSYRSDSLQEEEELLHMIMKGETVTVEFKEAACWNYRIAQHDPALIDNVTKTIAAFLNSSGGTLLIGVRDDGTLQDLQLDYEASDPRRKSRDGYVLFLSQKIQKKLGPAAMHKYDIQFFNIDQCDICRIEVKTSKEPVFWEHHFYSRIDSRSVSLTCAQFLAFLKNRGLL